MKKKTLQNLAIVFLLVALAIGIHQYINWGIFFEVSDIHHELFIAMFGFSGAVLWYIGRKKP